VLDSAVMAPVSPVLTGLNPAQREAVLAPPGPLLVLAGAGTGKTRVVIARIAHLVRKGARPERILAVTFTNKAAREMLARAGSLLGRRRPPGARPEISTIHSLCVRILRRHAPRLGYPERFTIIDRGEQEGMARAALKQLRVPDTVLRPADLLDRVSRWKSRGVRPDGALDSVSGDADDSWTLAAAGYRRYQEALRTAGAVDFDDLLLLVDELFAASEAVRRDEAGRFDHLLIDEYQDTSGIQERILAALARDHRSICVVGDDDQSIYAWRGAEIAHILDFAKRWPAARVVKLEQNYRSTPEIIRAANLLIERNARRHGKTLVSAAPPGVPPTILQAQDEDDEARRVTGDIESLIRERQVDPGEAVILVRTGEQTRAYEQELRRRGIPYELVGSRSFFDRREVKDVMAFLRFLVEPDDDLALARIANLPPRGLSAKTLQTARTTASERGTSLWQELVSARAAGRLTDAAAGGVTALDGLLALRRQEPAEEPVAAAVLRRMLDAIGYRAFLDKDYEDDPAEAETRWACVEEVATALDRHERTGAAAGATDLATVIRRFLDDFVLQVEEDDRFERDKPKGNVLRLMTLHAAKGLEFECVWMVGLEEGFLPHHRAVTEGLQAIDEERRLCYVGVTRAKRRLVLSLCLTRTKWGQAKPRQPSRFLYELTGQAEKFAAGTEPAAPAQPAVQRGRRVTSRCNAGKKSARSDQGSAPRRSPRRAARPRRAGRRPGSPRRS
jgi:DNA helicase-2/ATP-dependent DNA helicase PcrA